MGILQENDLAKNIDPNRTAPKEQSKHGPQWWHSLSFHSQQEKNHTGSKCHFHMTIKNHSLN